MRRRQSRLRPRGWLPARTMRRPASRIRTQPSDTWRLPIGHRGCARQKRRPRGQRPECWPKSSRRTRPHQTLRTAWRRKDRGMACTSDWPTGRRRRDSSRPRHSSLGQAQRLRQRHQRRRRSRTPFDPRRSGRYPPRSNRGRPVRDGHLAETRHMRPIDQQIGSLCY